MTDNVKIVREDPELEAAVREGFFDVAVPVSVFLSTDGVCTVTTLDITLDICRKITASRGSDFFSADAKDLIIREISPIMADLGYVCDEKASRVILEYVLPSTSEIAPSADAELVFDKSKISSLECPLLHRPEPSEDSPCAVLIRDARILSVAGINDFSDGDVTEIFTETAASHRGLGYAAECVRALSHYLVGEGESVGYFCGEDNASSVRVAEKCGFTLRGKRLSVVAYARE